MKLIKSSNRITVAALLLAIASATGGCEPFNPERARAKTDDARANARWLALTPLSSLYGTYAAIPARLSQDETARLKKHARELNCQTTTEIGNANIARYVREANGSMRLDSIVLDAYDSRTKRMIPADEIWVATAPESLQDGCTDFAIPVFADRGAWTQLPDRGLQYDYEGDILRKSDEKNFVSDHVRERIVIKHNDNMMELTIQYRSKSEGEAVDKTWRLNRLTSEDPATAAGEAAVDNGGVSAETDDEP